MTGRVPASDVPGNHPRTTTGGPGSGLWLPPYQDGEARPPAASESVAFAVEGPPQPKQRARKGRGGRWYTPEATRRFEAAVRSVAAIKLGRWRRDGSYRLTIRAVFADNRRRDVDNVLKSVADALNGLGYEDDSQIVETCAIKLAQRGDPRTVVLLERVGDAPSTRKKVAR